MGTENKVFFQVTWGTDAEGVEKLRRAQREEDLVSYPLDLAQFFGVLTLTTPFIKRVNNLLDKFG